MSRISSSQPEPQGMDVSSSPSQKVTAMERSTMFSFSQPNNLDHLLLSSQFQGTPGSSQTPMQKLVRRMTRFFVKTSKEDTLREMDKAIEQLGFTFKKNSPQMATISTLDRRRMPLVFKATLLEMGDNLLVDFRLSRGDGIEFKRNFIKLKALMKSVISKVPPAWPLVPSQIG
ncbi:hypothetical protein ScPMuIL_003072 [Solemya velum]